MDVKKCNVLAAEIRLETLKVIHSRGFGHVGGSMDLADLMAVLYGEVMKFDPKNPRWEDRDWLVLSKGHAGPVAYATFGLMGFYPMEEAYTLNQPHTKFPSHTDRKLTPGVDLTTGSLGQGASTAAGAALGNKIDGRTNHVFCVVGDGEADEGHHEREHPDRGGRDVLGPARQRVELRGDEVNDGLDGGVHELGGDHDAAAEEDDAPAQ